MEYYLESYADFEEEQRMLANESRKKKEMEEHAADAQKDVEFRSMYILGYFRRLSWRHKKHFILSIVKNIDCFDTLLRIINYISTLYGKMAAYVDVSPYCKTISQQIIVDHDRTIEADSLRETVCEDLIWIASLPHTKQIHTLMSLLKMAGGGLMRKLYLPIVNIYNNKVAEHARLQASGVIIKNGLTDIFEEPEPDDSDKYPRDHPSSIEVDKIRKKWDETIDKLRKEVFGVDTKVGQGDAKDVKHGKKTKAVDKKREKAAKKENKKTKKDKQSNKAGSSHVNWFQMLPIWIVKKILSYLDQKTLQNLKKVDSYWSYACDSVIKDRQAREFLNSALEKMKANVDTVILQACRENGEFLDGKLRHPDSPREKRLKKLMNRGAVLEEMRPEVKEIDQNRTCLITSIPKDEDIADSIDKIIVFPRLIKEDLLLYNKYPCGFKDVNILIDVDESLKKQRDTLSYSLSQQLSDTFSLSEANLAEW